MNAPTLGRSTPLDYTGPHGGAIAGAFIAAWILATAFWMALGGTIWRLFFEPRIKELKATIATEKADCDSQLDAQRNRILQLETLLIAHGPQQIRKELQASLSEISLESRGVAIPIDAAGRATELPPSKGGLG